MRRSRTCTGAVRETCTPSECAVRCAKAVEELIKFHQPSTVAALIAEPVTNDGVVPGPDYWPMLREICNEYGVVLIADEVTTGLGRTGKMFGVDHWGVEPDIMTMAGGLGGGYMPVGATTTTTAIADRFAGTDSHFRHVFTFAGHPVAAAVALKSIEIIEAEGLVENAAASGEYLMESLSTLTGDHPIVGDVRGLGLLCGIELVSDRTTKAGFGPDVALDGRLTAKFRRTRADSSRCAATSFPSRRRLRLRDPTSTRSCTPSTSLSGRSRASWASLRWLEGKRGAQLLK